MNNATPETLKAILAANRRFAAAKSEKAAARVIKAFRAHDQKTHGLWISDADIALINEAALIIGASH
jgi:carbonic anhydrase